MDNPLGTLIRDEVGRAESDYQAHRNRAQSVLTVSGLLVTALAGLLAVAAGKDAHLELSCQTKAVAAVTFGFFLAATVFVLIIFLPRKVSWPDEDGLAVLVDKHWQASNWDKKVAKVLVTYLASLREANRSLTALLAWAIFFQLLGLLGATVLAVMLIYTA